MFLLRFREKNRTGSPRRIRIHSERYDRKNRRFVLYARRAK